MIVNADTMAERERYANRLRAVMRQCGVTQTRLADEMGITPVALSLYINGKRAFPWHTVAYICKRLNITNPFDYFYSGEVKPRERKETELP